MGLVKTCVYLLLSSLAILIEIIQLPRPLGCTRLPRHCRSGTLSGCGLLVRSLFIPFKFHTNLDFFPTLSLTLWYPRHMLQYRVGLFFGAATLAGAFSGLLAFGIEHMNGTQGLEAWSWIFVRLLFPQTLFPEHVQIMVEFRLDP